MSMIKRLKVTVTTADDKVIETEFEGAIVLKYDVQYDVAIGHMGRFSLNLTASGEDKSLGQDWLHTYEEADKQ